MRFLNLFGGPNRLADGIETVIAKFGVEYICYDTEHAPPRDLLDPSVFRSGFGRY